MTEFTQRMVTAADEGKDLANFAAGGSLPARLWRKAEPVLRRQLGPEDFRESAAELLRHLFMFLAEGDGKLDTSDVISRLLC